MRAIDGEPPMVTGGVSALSKTRGFHLPLAKAEKASP